MNCELSLRAKDLPNKAGGTFGTSDPFAVVTLLALTPENQPKCLGQTEEIENCLSPEWSHVFRFVYDLGTPTKIAISIFDKSKKGFYRDMGQTQFDVGLIIESMGGTRAKKLKDGGVVIAKIRRGSDEGVLQLKIKGHRLRNVEGFMQKSDPFYEIHTRTETNDGFIDWELAYRSRVIMDNLSPVWPQHTVSLDALCDGDLNHPLKIYVYDHESDGDHDLIGEAQVTVNQLLDCCTHGRDNLHLAIPLWVKLKGRALHKQTRALAKAASSSKNNSSQSHLLSHGSQVAAGKLLILEGHVHGHKSIQDEIEVDAIDDDDDEQDGATNASGASKAGLPSFLDYVIGGLDINVVFAIDFSGSNGDPFREGTLHYLGENVGQNDYERSIIALLNVLGKFDADKHYAVWGFGAKYDGVLYKVFQCGENRLVSGISGVLETYRAQFRTGITMADTPTAFASVLRTGVAHSKKIARVHEKLGEMSYTILVVLSDSDVQDLEDTGKVMDSASDAPLSVIFVGIGETSDFRNMRFIDNDRQQRTLRDIAQFLQFNEFSRHSQKFTREALQEVPQQAVDYFHARKVRPPPPPDVTDDEINILPAEDPIPLVIDFDKDFQPFVKEGGTEYHDIFTELLDD